MDVNSGYWERNDNENLGLDEENEEVAERPKRVIPYVEDRKNILLINPSVDLEEGQLITLMFALKQGIQAFFQLEDNDLLKLYLILKHLPKSCFSSRQRGAEC